MAFFGDIGDFFTQTIPSGVSDLFSGVKSVINVPLDNYKAFGDATKRILGAAGSAGENLVTGVGNIGKGLGNLFDYLPLLIIAGLAISALYLIKS